MAFTAAEIARELDGTVIGDGSIRLTGFAPATTAKAGDLTFAENEAYFTRAEQSAAIGILVDGDFKSQSKVVIRVNNARIAFAKALALFFPEAEFAPGVHPCAVVANSASVDPTAHVGPLCVISENVKLGAWVVLEGGDHVGANCVLGDSTRLFPNVTLYPRTQVGARVRIHAGTIIGADGFGYVLEAGQHRKIPQAGNVIIHDDVEIGANVAIDRGTIGPTVIGKGTKIDNLVQIAHNVSVGEHGLIIGQTGISGSTKLGHHVTLAGQVGLTGHLKIGDGVTVGAQSGVMHDIRDDEKWLGTPAQPDRQVKRQLLALRQLPELLRRVGELEKKLGRSSTERTNGGSNPG